MKIKIEVTPEDIQKGERGSSTFCPIAQACIRQGFRNVSVASMILLNCTKTGKQIAASTPPRALKFINAFDGSLPVGAEPFMFEIDDDERTEREDTEL